MSAMPSLVDDNAFTKRALERVRVFYQEEHPEIKKSHGWEHVQKVYHHTKCALMVCPQPLHAKDSMEIEIAALLHDVDDKKYFPETIGGRYPNAEALMQIIGLSSSEGDYVSSSNDNNKNHISEFPSSSYHRILKMISWVSCSGNGNSVPECVAKTGHYHLLIPRWADRLEAVGARGVVRCYQYTKEQGGLLCSPESPRPTSEEELWEKYATPDRFQAYQHRGGSSADMISHYYDKLLHVASPPPTIVCNPYLEKKANESSKELVEVCLRYGRTGAVDEAYICGLME